MVAASQIAGACVAARRQPTRKPNDQMSFVAFLLMPAALLSAAPSAIETAVAPGQESADLAMAPADEADPARGEPALGEPAGGWPFNAVARASRDDSAWQVRIERQMTIRISPRAAPAPPTLLMDLPSREVAPRFIERKIGKCLNAAEIAGVQANGGNRLILFMRDRRMIGAELERACRARDFYSGFYLSRNSDGKLCVDRDTLLSRSGANCRLTRVRQLIELED